MKQIIIIISILGMLGCTPFPRYRTDGADYPAVIPMDSTQYTTNDYLLLGSILQKYLGKPYRGKSKYEEGLDCSHFTRSVFKKFDKINLPRTVAKQFHFGKEIHYRELNYGDLVFFKTERNRVSHVGIYIGSNNFIHASTSRGVIISSLKEKYWAKRYVGARRVLK